MRNRGIGLGLIPPGPRLALTIFFILYLQYQQHLLPTLGALALGAALLALNCRLRFKLLFVSAITITFTFIFLGNVIFPPSQCAGASREILGLTTKCALDVGFFFGTRRVGMLLVGFSWLNATSSVEMATLVHRSLRRFSTKYPYDRIGLFLFSIFDRLAFEYEIVNQSIAVRSHYRPQTILSRVHRNVYITYLKLSAVILRVFTNTPKIAFAIGMHGSSAQTGVALLQITGLFAGYQPGNDVLRGITLAAKAGDVILVRGSPGAGKSTLLRTIVRYIPRITGHARGEIVVGSESWLPSNKELVETLPSVRMVTQDTYEFFLGLTVKQEISLHTTDQQQIKNAIEVMGIADLLDRHVSTLSGGQRVKVILACVLASRVKLLLLDDPLSQLDDASRVAFIAGLRAYVRDVRPIVLVCDHFESYFIGLATRFLTIESGGALLTDSTPELPITEFKRVASNQASPTKSKEEAVAGLQNVTVVRGGQRVLQNFNLSIFPGEIVGITGVNGAGKTTAMLALAGLLPLNGGAKYGSDLVGISFQTPGLQFVRLKAEDELAVKGELSGVSPNIVSGFCRDELRWIGLESGTEVLDLSPFHGRMLSISSMLQDTRILVIDEPTIEMPLEQVPLLLARVDELKKKGVSIIIISHVLEIIHCCDRVIRI
jgi:energy-coupling factor transporter ATP-binding protein EcfA2